eukprot:jgi/Botrbrau1/9502/Bobra.0252s0117.1
MLKKLRGKSCYATKSGPRLKKHDVIPFKHDFSCVDAHWNSFNTSLDLYLADCWPLEIFLGSANDLCTLALYDLLILKLSPAGC